jgi:hypothetical protein
LSDVSLKCAAALCYEPPTLVPGYGHTDDNNQ